MNLARYFLHRVDGDWLVTFEGHVLARCNSRTEAVEAAAVMADLMGAMHHDADVMAEMKDGAPLELIWVYGKDRLPQPRQRRQDTVAEPHVKIVQRGVREARPAVASR